jgi:integrase
MASVRKRKWKSSGETHTAWVVDYVDQKRDRHIKTYATKKAADQALIKLGGEVQRGVHTADSESVTVADACRLWIERAEIEGLERSTVRGYRQHVDLHIVPAIGAVKLSRLTAPRVEGFKDDLLRQLSKPMARKVMNSLRGVLAEAMRRGVVAQNVAREIKMGKRGRHSRKLEFGVDIPTKDEIRAMLGKVTPTWRPLLVTAIFTGLRASELRGLTWEDVRLGEAVIRVRQRADRWNTIGAPKSEAGHRHVMIPPLVVNTLKEWKLRCPRRKRDKDDAGELILAFPNGAGNVETLTHLAHRFFGPLQAACEITRTVGTAEDGSPIRRPRYGLHGLRHFYASWLIDQGLPTKRVQYLMGHSTIAMTLDTYGHLFPATDDEVAKLATSAAALVG